MILIPKKTLESWKTLTSPESIQNMDAAWLCGFLHFAISTFLAADKQQEKVQNDSI